MYVNAVVAEHAGLKAALIPIESLYNRVPWYSSDSLELRLRLVRRWCQLQSAVHQQKFNEKSLLNAIKALVALHKNADNRGRCLQTVCSYLLTIPSTSVTWKVLSERSLLQAFSIRSCGHVSAITQSTPYVSVYAWPALHRSWGT